MSSLRVEGSAIICGHLTESDTRVGNTCKVEETTPVQAFEQVNAPGSMRSVSDYKEVSRLALAAGASRRASFCS